MPQIQALIEVYVHSLSYHDLGFKQATDGQMVAHVIRAVAGTEFSGQPHFHQILRRKQYQQ